MNHEQETAEMPTANDIAVGQPPQTPGTTTDTDDESALEPHIVRGLD
ncbi:hypothetical protein ACGFY7_37525 [Streptomyces prunicolor]